MVDEYGPCRSASLWIVNSLSPLWAYYNRQHLAFQKMQVRSDRMRRKSSHIHQYLQIFKQNTLNLAIFEFFQEIEKKVAYFTIILSKLFLSKTGKNVHFFLSYQRVMQSISDFIGSVIL